MATDFWSKYLTRNTLRAICALISFLFFVFTASAWANACVSAGAGPWTTTANWSTCGGTFPGSGDTVTITHAISTTANVIIGTSPAAGTAAVTINSGGSVSVGNSLTFTLKGDMNLNAGSFTLGNGDTFTFDSTGASSPTTTAYKANIGTTHNTAQAFISNGTSGARNTITSNTTGGAKPGAFTAGTGPWLQGGLIQATYTDFSKIGDASTDAMAFGATASGNTFSLDNCTLTTCGRINTAYAPADGSNVSITNCSFKSSAGSQSLTVNSSNGITSGTRKIQGCIFDKLVELYGPQGFTIGGSSAGQWNMFDAGFATTTSGVWASFSNNLIRGSSIANFGDVTNSYFLDDADTDNPHFFTIASGQSVGFTWNGVVFEAPSAVNSSDAGDLIGLANPATAQTYVIKNCLAVPSATGRTPGVLLSMLGGANSTAQVQHNTWVLTADDGTTNKPALGSVGETYNAAAGLVTIFKDNIAFSPTSRNAYLFRNINGAPVTDVLAAGNTAKNDMFNLLAGSALKGYNAPFSGTPGSTDFNVDPQFFDRTRNIAAWSTNLGGLGTVADALTQLRKKNDASGYNSAYTLPALWTYVRNGFQVQNATLHNAASDSADVGCCGYLASSNVSANLLMMGAD